jgi:hypothetical protein
VSNTPLNLKPDLTAEPPIRMVLQIVKDAIVLNADTIFLELDMELHLKVQEETKSLLQSMQNKSLSADEFFLKYDRLQKAFGVAYAINGVQNQMTPANGELFGDITKTLLLAAGISNSTKGEISAEFETSNPPSKWRIESKELARKIQLQRIRAT